MIDSEHYKFYVNLKIHSLQFESNVITFIIKRNGVQNSFVFSVINSKHTVYIRLSNFFQ